MAGSNAACWAISEAWSHANGGALLASRGAASVMRTSPTGPLACPRAAVPYVVDLCGDPTPGEAWGVRSLAREYGEIATAARSASTVLTRVQSSGSSAVWVGEAAEVFREKLEDFPENIAKCAASFEIVRDAMSSWASSVESWQSQADTNLNKARWRGPMLRPRRPP